MYVIQNDIELKFNILLYIKVIFLGKGWAYNREAGTTDALSGT